MNILILNGPNLNMLGKREPGIYGSESFEQIMEELRAAFPSHSLHYFQSNHEGAIIDRLQQCLTDGTQGLVANMGAFTHYSYAILDALRLLSIPKVEVHLSHIFAREAFRHTSVISPACDGMISGLGKYGYQAAIAWLLQVQQKSTEH
ncbi:MAG: 3-dehydroquinate dehydratase [Bacteroidetes bacterium]|nr:MAG: 3-dehydroquinate dehydratase [Bacteroidota bacterium]